MARQDMELQDKTSQHTQDMTRQDDTRQSQDKARQYNTTTDVIRQYASIAKVQRNFYRTRSNGQTDY